MPRRAVHLLARVLAALSVVLILVMMVATVADVISRLVVGRPIAGVIEMGEVLMVAIVFLGLAYTESQGGHVSMTLVIRKLRPQAAAAATSLGLALVLFVVAWMTIVTGDRALESFESQEARFGLVQIPVWPARVALAIGLLAYFAELLPRFADNIRQAVRPHAPSVDH
jgi:TRAP-type C4-dicarboxylate transport system permease small subunit